jgi:hypothetical protein
VPCTSTSRALHRKRESEGGDLSIQNENASHDRATDIHMATVPTPIVEKSSFQITVKLAGPSMDVIIGKPKGAEATYRRRKARR